MDNTDKKRIINRYNARLSQYGDDIRSLASGSEERRSVRFEVLCDVGSLNDCSVLDLGCGFGDLYGYIKRRGYSEIKYTGYDINPKLIQVAKEKYPQAAFSVKDIETEPFPSFDYILSTSTFNLPLHHDDNYRFIENMLNICFRHARHGVAIDFLSSYVDYESEEGFHYIPERIFAIAKKITKRVCLRHDYPLFEFCVYLYPDFQGWGEGNHQ
jgi:SAM-dependent methyltransferase